MLPRGLDTFFVGHDFENASIEHCLFRLTRQLPLMQQCTADTLFWFLPLFDTVSRFARITALATFAGIPTSYALSFMGIITHFATSIVLRKSFPTDSSDKNHARYASYSYFLNPLLAVSCLMSPVPSMLHLLLAVANYSALTGRKLLLYACLSLLVSGHFAFICAAPAYIILLRATGTQHALSRNISTSRSLTRNGSTVRWVTAAIAAVAVSVMILPYLELSSTSMTGFLGVRSRLIRFLSDQAQKVSHRCLERKSLNHEPGANFMWYMDVQVFSKFSDYFLILIPGQPFLFVFPLLIRMSPRRPLHTVRHDEASLCLHTHKL
jgi:GPI transamidase subunit PIG-U